MYDFKFFAKNILGGFVMLTIISFLLTILGCINWLLIGLLQYDFVAGIFGYQASILSRIVYIIIGASSVFLIYKLIKGKGTIAVFSFRNKKDLAKNIKKIGKKDEEEQNDDVDLANANLNVEASDEFPSRDDEPLERREHIEDYRPSSHHDGLFNEHFGDRDEF